jgi:hypothetical protein
VNTETKRRREAHDPGRLILGTARDATATYWLRGDHRANPSLPNERACLKGVARCVLMRAPRPRRYTLKPGLVLGPHPEE